MTWLRLVVLSLAVWRLSYMIAREHGAFGMFSKLRSITTLGGLLDCPKCLSVWMAFGLYLLDPYTPHIANLFALSGLALLAHRYTGGDFEGS